MWVCHWAICINFQPIILRGALRFYVYVYLDLYFVCIQKKNSEYSEKIREECSEGDGGQCKEARVPRVPVSVR